MSFSNDFTTSFVKGLGKTIGVVTIFSTIGVLYNFYLFFNQKKTITPTLPSIEKIQNENVQNVPCRLSTASVKVENTDNVKNENIENVENDNFDDKRRFVFTETEIRENDLYYDDQNENVSFKMLFDRIK
jgi:hypothetical protein